MMETTDNQGYNPLGCVIMALVMAVVIGSVLFLLAGATSLAL